MGPNPCYDGCDAMKITKKRYWALFGMACAVLCMVAVHPVSADSYGKGNYSTCRYAFCPPPTTGTLPSGLQVSINLADGQTVPRSGYRIMVTPLNGSGSSFKQIEIYIGGVLAATVQPDDTGSASWMWKPQTNDDTAVKIIVTDTNDQAVPYEFTIHIDDSSAAGSATSQNAGNGTPSPTLDPGNHTKPTGIAALLNFTADSLEKLSQSAVRIIQSLPRPLAYSFPYILIALLGLHALLLLFQMHREVREYHVLRSLLAHEKMIAESKKTFMELVSHYLRTPITIVLGGIDMLSKQTTPAATITQLQTAAKGMGSRIESLIADTRTASEIALSQRGDTALSATALWRQPGLFVPVLLILIILLPYNYLAQHGGTLTITQVNIMAQAFAFLALATVAYLVFRQLRLRRRDKHEIQRLSATQIASNQVRDELITSTATTLRANITTIDTLMGQLTASQATKFIHEGQERFHDVLTKCTVAASLRGGRSTNQYTDTTLGTLLTAAEASLQNKIQARRIISSQQDPDLHIQNPDLITYVIHTVLDNALTYSRDGSIITIDTSTTKHGGTDIAITDTGEGMPAAKQSLLFQPFFKVEGAEEFNHEGMGFSLYLDKLIMEYLGGAITVVSQKGHGTTVTLHMPAPAKA